MTYWERKPLAFQIMLIIIGFLLLTISMVNFYRNITSPTDDNYFQELKNFYYLTKGMPVKSITFQDTIKKETMVLIPSGAILNTINNIKIANDSSLIASLIDNSNSEFFNVEFYDLTNRKPLKFTIPRNEFDINKLRFIKSAVFIIDVKSGGASDRAGITVGDIILKINNKSFKNVMEADNLMKKNAIDGKSKYIILRNNQQIEISVQLSKYGVDFTTLSLFLNGLLIFLLGMYIGLMRPGLIAARILSLAFVLLGYSISSASSLYQVEYDSFSFFRAIFITISLLYGLSLLFHSFYYFPKEISSVLKKQWIFKIPYLISAISFTVILFLLVFYIDYVKTISIVNIIAIGIIITYYQFVRFLNLKKISKEDIKFTAFNRYSAGIFIIIFFMMPIALNFIRVDIFNYASLLIAIFPISYFYTIVKYGLLDLNLKISKNLQFTFIQFLWNMIIVVLVGYSMYLISTHNIEIPNLHFNGSYIEVIEHPLSFDKQEMYQRMLSIILFIFALIFFYFLRNLVLNYLRKVYNRADFDFKSINLKFTNTFFDEYTDAHLNQKIINNIAEILKIKRVGTVFFHSNDSILSQEFYNFEKDELTDFHNNNSKFLFFSISQFNGPITIDYLPEKIKQVYNDNNIKIIIPVRSKGKLAGYFLIGEKLAETPFNSEELSILNSIAIQAGITIENSYLYSELSKRERMKHELELARKIQLATLPDTIPNVTHLEIDATAIPAYEVGGDFYDYLIDNLGNLTIVVGDVSGKGTSAALIMSKAQGIMRALHSFELTPKELLEKTNGLLLQTLTKGNFVTVLAAKFIAETKTAIISRAGHLPLYYFSSKTNKVQKILPNGLVIGISKNETFGNTITEESIKYQNGDIFVMISDGIIEARNTEGNEFGEQELIKLIQQNHNKSSFEIKSNIIETVNNYSNNTAQFDDMTIVVVKINI